MAFSMECHLRKALRFANTWWCPAIPDDCTICGQRVCAMQDGWGSLHKQKGGNDSRCGKIGQGEELTQHTVVDVGVCRAEMAVVRMVDALLTSLLSGLR